MTAPSRLAFVDYLELEPEPHLIAQECISCNARYFDRRNACASCFGVDFHPVPVATSGTLRAFSIIAFASPGIEVPYIAGIIDCDGTSVRGNVVNCPPHPDHVVLGMPLRLTTVSLGLDAQGTEAVNFGFEPVEGATV